jgi:hypothetical protein
LVTAAYVLDFLCIHPFRDRNGRMARSVIPRLARWCPFLGSMDGVFSGNHHCCVPRI